MNHPREFPDYQWLFQMPYISCYGARLAEETEKKMKKELKKERKKEDEQF